MTNLPAEVRVPARSVPGFGTVFWKSDRFVKLRPGSQKTPLSDSFCHAFNTVEPGVCTRVSPQSVGFLHDGSCT